MPPRKPARAPKMRGFYADQQLPAISRQQIKKTRQLKLEYDREQFIGGECN